MFIFAIAITVSIIFNQLSPADNSVSFIFLEQIGFSGQKVIMYEDYFHVRYTIEKLYQLSL